METLCEKPDAIVFIPGTLGNWGESVVEGLGKGLIVALERNSPSRFRFQIVIPISIYDGGER